MRIWRFHDGFRLTNNGHRFSVDRYGNVRRRLKTRRDEFGKPIWKPVSGSRANEIRSLVVRETDEIPMKWQIV